MTKQTESAISNETGRQLTDQDKAERRLAEALYEGFKSKADAMVIGSIDEVGIDGEFNLLEIAVGALSRMSNRDG